MRKPMGIIFIVIGILIFLFVVYANSPVSKVTRVYSPYSLLTSSWEKYKGSFITAQGRSIDPLQQNTTTSEAQSYAMLRAVWVDDKKTFDNVYTFTQANLKRRTDHLFGWRYGTLPNGSVGFLPEGGSNSASDADSDIAFALILAGKRWNNPYYINEAKQLLPDIWKTETATASGKRYFIAGNWAQDATELIINPSYFAPYEWRVFAQVDKYDSWLSLLKPAYQLLHDVGTNPLDTGSSVGLPPDWVSLDRTTGQLSAPRQQNLSTHYSFDAMRIPWRIALDYLWNKDVDAKDYLNGSFSFLTSEFQSTHTLAGAYAHDGKRVSETENPAMYAAALGYFIVSNKKLADTVYQNKIIKLYSNDQDTFRPNLSYYDQNWLWFGAALYNGYLKQI